MVRIGILMKPIYYYQKQHQNQIEIQEETADISRKKVRIGMNLLKKWHRNRESCVDLKQINHDVDYADVWQAESWYDSMRLPIWKKMAH